MTRRATHVLALLRFGLTGWTQFGGKGSGPRRLGGVAVGLVALAASLLFVFLIVRGWLYPLNPDMVGHLGSPLDAELGPHVWGGPTLAGAWAAHAAVAIAMQAVCLGVIGGCRRVRVTRGTSDNSFGHGHRRAAGWSHAVRDPRGGRGVGR